MEKIKWGLIGCGDISRKRVAPALVSADKSELVALSRSKYELAESFAKEFGAKRWYKDWKEVIKDDEVNAVYIATPVYLHAEEMIYAAENGKHVLCEKPMAMTVEECKKMLASAEKNNIKFGIAYYRRFYPSIIRIKEIIKSGEIGNVVFADVKALGWFDKESHEERGWLLQKEKSGGGPLKDFGCHRIEILLNLFGEVKNINSLNSSLVFEREVEDTSVIQFEFAEKTMGTLTVSHAINESVDTIDIYGTKGSIHIPDLNQALMRINVSGSMRQEFLPPPQNFHQPLIEDFIDAVLRDRRPAVDGYDGLAVEEVITAAYK